MNNIELAHSTASVNDSSNDSSPDLLVEHDGAALLLTLNRPRALNALSRSIIDDMSAGLPRWAADKKIETIILRGAGDRAFCAGGDIKAAYYAGQAWKEEGGDDRVLSDFFYHEYRLNRALFHCRKPVVALMDGITMGGGYGLAGQASFRVATENTLFAMPETGIGFFPDVGSVWHLNRSPARLGYYLGVTGNHVRADDMLAARLADHYVAAADIAALTAALVAGEVPKRALRDFSARPEPGVLRAQKRLISRAFAAADIDGVMACLAEEGSAFARETMATIRGRSPTSVKLALAYLRRMRGKPFDRVIAHDYAIAQRILQGHDFYEGVRAMVIDKDRQPQWNPASLADVPDSAIDAFFAPAPYGLD